MAELFEQPGGILNRKEAWERLDYWLSKVKDDWPRESTLAPIKILIRLLKENEEGL